MGAAAPLLTQQKMTRLSRATVCALPGILLALQNSWITPRRLSCSGTAPSPEVDQVSTRLMIEEVVCAMDELPWRRPSRH